MIFTARAQCSNVRVFSNDGRKNHYGTFARHQRGITQATWRSDRDSFRKTKRLGAAIRICNLIKGRDVISQYDVLCAAAGELGIPADTVDKSLSELEEIGYVSLARSGGDIAKIEERIPLLDAQY